MGMLSSALRRGSNSISCGGAGASADSSGGTHVSKESGSNGQIKEEIHCAWWVGGRRHKSMPSAQRNANVSVFFTSERCRSLYIPFLISLHMNLVIST